MDREGCIHLKCTPDKCRCSLGKKLGLDGTVSTISILKGEIPISCRDCEEFMELRVYDCHTVGLSETGEYGVVVVSRFPKEA